MYDKLKLLYGNKVTRLGKDVVQRDIGNGVEIYIRNEIFLYKDKKAIKLHGRLLVIVDYYVDLQNNTTDKLGKTILLNIDSFERDVISTSRLKLVTKGRYVVINKDNIKLYDNKLNLICTKSTDGGYTGILMTTDIFTAGTTFTLLMYEGNNIAAIVINIQGDNIEFIRVD